MTTPGAVFLSYASQDAEVATRICEALRAAGGVVWFDQNELVGGDAWDAKIRGQIKACALFVPVISAATQARREGYFRLEWKLAAQRTHTMADGTPFLLPVVIDATRDGEALVPEEFRAVQWTRLPGGETGAGFCARVKTLLGGEVALAGSEVGASLDGAPGSPHANGRGRATPLRRSGRWLWAGVLGVAVIVTLAIWRPWKEAARATAPNTASASPSTEKSTAPITEAQKLVAQARQVFEESDEMNRENLFLAEDLVKRALAFDAAEPAAWELSAWLSYFMVWHQIDASDARRSTLRRQAARALALAPRSVSVQLLSLNTRISGGWGASPVVQQRDLPEIERELVALAAGNPANWQVQRSLGMTYRFLNRPDESIAALRRAVELSDGETSATSDLANVLERRKRLDESEVVIAAGLARKRTGRLLAQDVFMKSRWRADLAGASTALESWPGWLLQEDRGLFLAWQTSFWSRQPEKALTAPLRVPRDYLRDAFFAGPRAVLTARAHEMAGHAEAAAADWRAVVQAADRELAQTPDDPSAQYWQAWALARLGETDRARALCAILLQRTQSAPSSFFKGTNLAPLLVTAGMTDAALADVRTQLTTFNDTNAVTRAVLELDPAYDPIRADPRFQALVESAPAPAKKIVSATVNVDAKSVAVLAFANLSDDKNNEYFSDGISEELLNVLAKVPGLKVSARTSAFHFKGKDTPIPEIARQLGVAYVVEGSVRKSGNQVRITALLIKATDGFHVWSDTFTRELKDSFAVQDEIAGLIAKNLSLKLGTSSGAATATINPQAFEFYFRAREAWKLRTLADYDRAEELLNRALVLEPNFARAHAALADVWFNRAQDLSTIGSFAQRNSPEHLRMVAKINQALALDPELAEAHASLGGVAWMTWQMAEGERALRRAIALNPNYATAHQWLGRLLSNDGRMDEALAELKLATEIDPLAPRILDNYGLALYLAGRSAEAIEIYDRALALQPNALQTLANKAQALAAGGRLADGVALARTLSVDGANLGARGARIIVLAQAGLKAEAEALLAGFGEKDIRYKPASLLALGRKEEALARLTPASFFANDLSNFLFEPLNDSIRTDPRIEKLFAEVGVTDAHARAQAWRAAHPPEKPESKK